MEQTARLCTANRGGLGAAAAPAALCSSVLPFGACIVSDQPALSLAQASINPVLSLRAHSATCSVPRARSERWDRSCSAHLRGKESWGFPHRPPCSGVRALLFTETKAFCQDEPVSLRPTLCSHLAEVLGLRAP